MSPGRRRCHPTVASYVSERCPSSVWPSPLRHGRTRMCASPPPARGSPRPWRTSRQRVRHPTARRPTARRPSSPTTDPARSAEPPLEPGLVWLTEADALDLAPAEESVAYVANLKLDDPSEAPAFVDTHLTSTDGDQILESWQNIRDGHDQVVRDQEEVLRIGSWLLGAPRQVGFSSDARAPRARSSAARSDFERRRPRPLASSCRGVVGCRAATALGWTRGRRGFRSDASCSSVPLEPLSSRSR